MPNSPWVVHKFGGTSVADASRYKSVAQILPHQAGERKAVVVSAMAKVTDSLIDLTERAVKRDDIYHAKSAELKKRHLDTARTLLKDAEYAVLAQIIEADFRDIEDVLRAIWLGRSCSELVMELIAGYGEVWSAQLLCAYLQSQGTAARWCDARKVLIVKPGEAMPIIDWEVSQQRFDEWLRERPCDLLVITGYVASTPDGVATTLKRNGSDFSASIFGALLAAREIVIWTDVDGILSADPRRVPEAVVLAEMSYDEAIELAYFGAKVVHPHTMAPAMTRNIPIWIRNAFNPQARGTRIAAAAAMAAAPAMPVKGFSTIDRVALIDLEGTGMMGVPGIASRLFGALKEVGVSVIMISQASSEHSICFAVPEAQADLAQQTVEKAFYAELHQGEVETVTVLKGCTILAAVGDNMVHTQGVAARFFGALAKASVNVRAIAQGSSERNISTVIAQDDSTRALRAVHAGFFLSQQTLSIGVVGTGTVGSALLRQLGARVAQLNSERKIDLRVRGIANTRQMLMAETALDLNAWPDALAQKGAVPNLDAFVEHVRARHLPHAIIVDCTASEQIARQYPDWLERGIHIVTANKKANSVEQALYGRLRSLSRDLRRHYLYAATVGAGLPVLSTLRDLIQTGDRVERIEGALSGTVSFLLNAVADGRRFSEALSEARQCGYSEPDPREDLSGRDVARKLIILAREMGLSLEIDKVSVENLVPGPLASLPTVEEFMRRAPELDESIARRAEEAREKDEVVRFVGVLTGDGQAEVGLKTYSRQHPFARISGTDSIIAFTTARYHDHPLIIQGPGAGPEVTASSVFADILRIAAYVGAPT